MSPSPAKRRQPPRWLLLTIATAVVVEIAITIFLLLKPTNAPAAQLVLSTSQVKIGDSYFAIASGFSPGEDVQFSWIGPTNGVMGVFHTDSAGSSSNQVWERDPPGTYTITVTGLASGRTTSADLQVIQPGN